MSDDPKDRNNVIPLPGVTVPKPARPRRKPQTKKPAAPSVSLAVRAAAREARDVMTMPAGRQLTLLAPPTSPPAPAEWHQAPAELPAERRTVALRPRWPAIGRALVGLALVGCGAAIAYTSLEANAWFGRSLTPDPAAGAIYSHLSVIAEVTACLIPTANRLYWQDGQWMTALRGWVLLVVCLAVVFFAAGGFAITNLTAGTEARAERSTADTVLAQRRLDAATAARTGECAKRGPKCRDMETQERDAIAALERARATVKAEADPQAIALGVSSAQLHAVQAGALVLLCLFSGLFISLGSGLIFSPAKGAP